MVKLTPRPQTRDHEGRSAMSETTATRGPVTRAPELSVRRVTHHYPSTGTTGAPVEALRQVDLDIAQGQFVAVVGASGCGKTTLLNMLAGTVAPSSGEVLVGGEPARCPHPEVSYMAARDALLPWRTVRRNVEFGLEHRVKDRSARRERARHVLELVGLADFESAFPRQLSHGMRQRTNLARTLATEPRVLLMDEPFAALDAQTKLRLQGELLRILEDDSADRPKTVVFVTHDLQEAVLLADRVIVMRPRPGRIALDQVVDLPRPRSHHLRRIMFSSVFKELHQKLFDLLEGDLELDEFDDDDPVADLPGAAAQKGDHHD
jgi:NitT/TauT family transport system ATP-binding protein